MTNQDTVSYMQLKDYPRCSAVAESTGERCKRIAKKDMHVCGIHAGHYSPGAPKGNQNAKKHGVSSKQIKEYEASVQELLDIYCEALKDYKRIKDRERGIVC